MGIFSLPNSIVFISVVSFVFVFVQPSVIGGNSNSNLNYGGIFEGKEKVPEPPIKPAKCPNASQISPCECFISSGEAGVDCNGPAVNDTSIIDNLFRELRRVNQIPEDGGLNILEFAIQETKLTLLDLAPFYGSKITWLDLSDNLVLRKLVTSGKPEDHGSIQALDFYVRLSPLTRDGFGDTLKYFSNDLRQIDMWQLDLKTNDNNNNSSDEFLPGFSVHTNLTGLTLEDCNITGQLTSDTWNFQGLHRLSTIYLVNHSINGVGENVFDFDVNGGFLDIFLESNKLNETSFHPNSGISRTGRRTFLYLGDNQITTLPLEIFQPFLDAHPLNSLSFYRNPLICDERLSWLKSRKEEFQNRVFYVTCSNDPEHDIFDSDLIP